MKWQVRVQTFNPDDGSVVMQPQAVVTMGTLLQSLEDVKLLLRTDFANADATLAKTVTALGKQNVERFVSLEKKLKEALGDLGETSTAQDSLKSCIAAIIKGGPAASSTWSSADGCPNVDAKLCPSVSAPTNGKVRRFLYNLCVIFV